MDDKTFGRVLRNAGLYILLPIITLAGAIMYQGTGFGDFMAVLAQVFIFGPWLGFTIMWLLYVTGRIKFERANDD